MGVSLSASFLPNLENKALLKILFPNLLTRQVANEKCVSLAHLEDIHLEIIEALKLAGRKRHKATVSALSHLLATVD